MTIRRKTILQFLSIWFLNLRLGKEIRIYAAQHISIHNIHDTLSILMVNKEKKFLSGKLHIDHVVHVLEGVVKYLYYDRPGILSTTTFPKTPVLQHYIPSRSQESYNAKISISCFSCSRVSLCLCPYEFYWVKVKNICLYNTIYSAI